MEEKVRYYYPVLLRNKRLTPFKFSQEVELVRLAQKQREEFFGLKKVNFEFQDPPVFGFLAIRRFEQSKTKKGILPASDFFKGPSAMEDEDILASNYVLVIHCKGSESPHRLLEEI